MDYINKYNLLCDPEIKCDYIEFMIYKAFIDKFVYEMNKQEYHYFNLYYERVVRFVKDLRENDIDFINQILILLKSKTTYMVDLVIMQWSLPDLNLLSKSLYRQQYKNLIEKYNKKLFEIDNTILNEVCTKLIYNNKSFPIHCVDILWQYISKMEIELIFINMQSANYVTIKNNINDNSTIIISINIEYLLYLNLGQIKNNEEKDLKSFIKHIITTKELYDYLKSTTSGRNFVSQCCNIKQQHLLD